MLSCVHVVTYRKADFLTRNNREDTFPSRIALSLFLRRSLPCCLKMHVHCRKLFLKFACFFFHSIICGSIFKTLRIILQIHAALPLFLSCWIFLPWIVVFGNTVLFMCRRIENILFIKFTWRARRLYRLLKRKALQVI